MWLRRFKKLNESPHKRIFTSPFGDKGKVWIRTSTNSANPFGAPDQSSEGYGVREAFQVRKQAFYDKIWNANAKYEEFIGLTDVLVAQQRVRKAEKEFTEARAKERSVLRELVETREKLKDIRERLSHIDYSNKMYLQLASDQHELVNEEEKQKRELDKVEEQERNSFLELTTAMRESYEHERARVERTKNWSIIGTVIGAIIGMISAIYVNRMRTKELLRAVKESGSQEQIEKEMEKFKNELDKNQTATVTALKSVAENLAEMGEAIHVQNLQVMAGFVEDTMKEKEDSAAASKTGVRQAPITPSSIRALSEEIASYNAALGSLVKAVTALSKSPRPQDFDSDGVENLLTEQIRIFTLLRTDMDQVLKTMQKTDWIDISSRLESINRKLSSLTVPQGGAIDTEGPIIYELPPDSTESQHEPDWPIGVKDALLWGSILCSLYLLIKF